MNTHVLHDAEQQRDIEGHHRYHRAGPGDQRLVDRDEGFAADTRQVVVQLNGGLLQMLLGRADSARPVDRVGDFGADVGIGDGLRSVGQDSGFLERPDPQGPVLTAHHLDGVGLVFSFGRFHSGLAHGTFQEVHRLRGVGLSQGLEDRLVGDAGIRIGSDRGGDGIDHQIHLSEEFLHLSDDHLTGIVREGIRVEAFGGQSGGLSSFVEVLVVVPAGTGGFALAGLPLEADVQRSGAGAERGGDPGGQAVAGGPADHQHPPGHVDGGLIFHIDDLLFQSLLQTGRMGGEADSSDDFRLQYHHLSPIRQSQAASAASSSPT